MVFQTFRGYLEGLQLGLLRSAEVASLAVSPNWMFLFSSREPSGAAQPAEGRGRRTETRGHGAYSNRSEPQHIAVSHVRGRYIFW
jgi:hypothetical protein